MNTVPPDSASFGTWVRRARQARGLTQDILAEQVGCATATIRKIEASERRPSFQMASRLAQMLGVADTEQQSFIDAARAIPEPLPDPIESVRPEQSAPILPNYVTALIGRTKAQADLLQMLSNPECRLVTILGAGGIGKTRLAVATAVHLQDTAQRIAFVPLINVQHSAVLPTAIADQLGLMLKGSADTLRQLIQHMQAGPILLILDGSEHLLHERGFTLLLTSLLSEVPQLKLLVTSRERLRISGEWVLELSGLCMPDDEQGRDAEHSEAVVLFLDRARRMVDRFALDHSNRAAITRITQLLDGNPLALELAATWVRLLTCAEIAAEIERNIDFLNLADRDVPAQHRSMRAVFDHSWQILQPHEQVLLARLAVFRGGFTREAVSEVAGASLRDLAELANKSLLMPGQHRRYTLHELLRLFAFEQLERLPGDTGTAERVLVQTLHLDYFLHLAEQTAPELENQHQITSLRQLEAEHENFRAALSFAFHPDASDALHVSGARLVAALEQFWFIRGHLSEALRWMKLALQHTALDSQPQARIHTVFGFFALLRHDLPTARKHLELAIPLSRRFLDHRSEALGWHYLGLVESLAGNTVEDRAAQLRCYQIAEKIGDDYLMALAEVKLGHCEQIDGKLEQAEIHYRNGIQYFITTSNPNQLAGPLRRLGHLMLLRQEPGQALDNFRESLRLNLDVGDMRATAACLLSIACAYWTQSAIRKAAQLFGAHEQLLQSNNAFLMPADRNDCALLADAIRAALDDQTLRAAYHAGKQLSLEQATQMAIQDRL